MSEMQHICEYEVLSVEDELICCTICGEEPKIGSF